MNNTKAKKITIKSLEGLLVIGYILFEELIWNVFAKPLYQYFKSLIVLDRLKNTFLSMNRYLLLTVFIFILAIAEGLGIFSGLCIINGFFISGILIYALKIPIAAFTFWLFDLTKPKLMTFQVIKISYQSILNLIDKFVNSDVYIYIKKRVSAIRSQTKAMVKLLFGEQGFRANMKNKYLALKPVVLNLIDNKKFV